MAKVSAGHAVPRATHKPPKRSETLVSTSWLADRLAEGPLWSEFAVLDATWEMPAPGAAKPAWEQRTRIAGSRFFDIDACAVHATPLPHMLPTPAEFARYMEALGITRDTDICVYDRSGQFVASARVWWTLMAYGHRGHVTVLDGGLLAWQKEGRGVESGAVSPLRKSSYILPAGDAQLSKSWAHHYRNKAGVMQDLEDKRSVVDARPAARFLAQVDEPRANVRRGNIPGSTNVPHASVLEKVDTASDGATPIFTLLDQTRLEQVLSQAKVNLDKPVTLSCGSGVTASVLALAMFNAGFKDLAVYDGSWSEWGWKGPALP